MHDPCTHEQQILRYRIHADNSKHYVMQCLDCGEKVEAVKRVALTDDQERYALPWNQELQDQKRAERSEAFRQIQDELWAQRRADHAEYLQSPEWQERRRLRLEQDNHRCQARLSGCSNLATQVHHLTYESWGNEPLFELVSVCRSCHEQISSRKGQIQRRSEVA
jgi:hypothetical protein